MLKKLKNLFRRSINSSTKIEVIKVKLSDERIEQIKKNNLFQFTDKQTLLVKNNHVLGKINKIEKMTPGCLIKGKLTWVYLYEAIIKGDMEEFLTFDDAMRWLLSSTSDHWVD